MDMKENIDEILSACIDRLIAGASLDDVLAGQPVDVVDALAPALRNAQTLLRSGVIGEPEGAAREAARELMLTELDTARAKAYEFKAVRQAVEPSAAAALVISTQENPSWFAAFMRRPASFRVAAVAGSVAVFGVLGIGAAAATGNAPEPVRELFRSSGTSGLRIEFEGVITAVDPAAATMSVQIGDDERLVQVVDATELSRGGEEVAFGDFAVGDFVEVRGALQPDDMIVASRLHLEDDGDDGTAEPGATATPNDDDDGDADNSGPGNADDDGEGDDDDQDDDNSGPGNADDDGEGDDDDQDDDNSGHGNADDDLDDDGNSGSGNADDDRDDDEDEDDDDDD